MNRDIVVSLPKGSNVRTTIQDKYTELFNAWRRSNPTSTVYTPRKLSQNIRQALSIHGKTFKEEEFKHTDYQPWGDGLCIQYCHWYYLVDISADKKRNLIALVVDARYEGDYHNDTMNTTPYGESTTYLSHTIITESRTDGYTIRFTESQFKIFLTECIKKIIKEII